jgi:low temperature requirement protein LtrA
MTRPGANLIRRMTGRDVDEEHRVSTNLELLFDLTFVVAVSQIARQLSDAVSLGHYRIGLEGYLMVFFAIWWAWMNFTWFASAFDTDDVPYRLLTLLQMAGVLVLAAGVPKAFADNDFAAITVGYLIMRVAMIGQWLRAARGDPTTRLTCLRYAAGIFVVQVGWVLRLLLIPDRLPNWTFLALALAELAVPLWAERTAGTNWHPEHIAERYGLFTIIILGECVSQASVAVQSAFSDHGVSTGLVVTALAGLVLLFGIWWVYFAKPVEDHLRARRERSYLWGYGHYFAFGALAAVAAGLEVAVESGSEHLEISRTAVGLAVAIPLAIFLVAFAALQAYVSAHAAGAWPVLLTAAVGLVAAVSGQIWPVPVALTLIALAMVGLVAYELVVHQPRLGLSAEA